MKEEGKAMKRKLATLLMLALTITMLGGCGGNSETGTSIGSASSSTDSGSKKKADTLSEYLSTEKTIGYMVEEMDKAETPELIYFFEDGKLTIIPGEEFEMTLGDFSQMEENEIWEKYASVRETYAENYKAEKLSETHLAEWKGILENRLKCVQSFKDVLEKGYIAPEDDINDYYDFLSGFLDTLDSTASEDIGLKYHYAILERMEASEGDEVSIKVNTFISDEYMGMYEEYVGTEILQLETRIAEYNEYLSKVQQELDACVCKGPFYDMPFTFAIVTDATGNNVQNEKLVYPTRTYSVNGMVSDTLLESLYSLDDGEYDEYEFDYSNFEIPENVCSVVTFAMVDSTEKQIYDTNYTCLGLGKGESIFCTRDYMKLDTVESKNVLIDPTDDELNALYKEEVSARYE